MKSFLKNWGFPALIALAFVAYVAAERPAGLPLYFTICAAATASVGERKGDRAPAPRRRDVLDGYGPLIHFTFGWVATKRKSREPVFD